MRLGLLPLFLGTFLQVPLLALGEGDGVLTARQWIGPDHITVRDIKGRRVDLGTEKKWHLPLSLELEATSSASLVWEELDSLSLHVKGGSQLVVGRVVDRASFPQFSGFPRLELDKEIFLSKGVLWVEMVKAGERTLELRTPTHLLKWSEAFFRVEVSGGKLLVEVLGGKVEAEDLWLFPGVQKKLGALQRLEADSVKGNQLGLLTEERLGRILGEVPVLRPKWLENQTEAKGQAYRKIQSERLLRYLNKATAPERRLETGLLEREAHFRVEY